MKSRAANTVLKTLAAAFGSPLGQSVLERSATLAAYLQGIGSGGDVASSGEAAVFSRLPNNR